MSAGPTANRVFDDLRTMVVRGELAPGFHLDPGELAAQLCASTTPVREALNRLIGENLVETRQGSGFYMPMPDVEALKDLYAWIGDIAVLALRATRPPAPGPTGLEAQTAPPSDEADYAGRTARAFACIAGLSGNTELHAAMARANGRIHAFRMAEPQALRGAAGDLAGLEATIIAGDARNLRRLVGGYTRQRTSQASRIVRLRYRG